MRQCLQLSHPDDALRLGRQAASKSKLDALFCCCNWSVVKVEKTGVGCLFLLPLWLVMYVCAMLLSWCLRKRPSEADQVCY